MADGSLQGLKRRKGAKNTLVDENDRPLPDDHLQRWLGPVDRTQFGAEFGLTAEALRKGGRDLLRERGGLAETLAASSAGLSALSALREKLAAEADALFTPRKSAGKTFYRRAGAARRRRAAPARGDRHRRRARGRRRRGGARSRARRRPDGGASGDRPRARAMPARAANPRQARAAGGVGARRSRPSPISPHLPRARSPSGARRSATTPS